jgi:hypothetical protein
VISIVSFSCSWQVSGGGDFCKIFALLVPEKLFWGGYLKDIWVNPSKKVFPAPIMHFAEITGTR